MAAKRIFDVPNLVIIAVLVGVGFLLPIIALWIDKAIHQKGQPDETWIPTILGAKNGERGVLIGLEAAILALLGGLIACGFISFLLSSAHDSNRANITLGTAFLIAPGLIALGTKQATPEGVMAIAAIVGGFTGMMAGIYRICDWEGLGWIAFPLDVTWGLTGNTVGALLHVVNIGWGDHATAESERRQNAHRYASGFGFSTFAFTEGNVRSNLNAVETDRLAKHERTHVWQNRFFGPFYVFTYVGWLVVWVFPGVVAGIVKRGWYGFIQGPFSWCYYNNPFETWAYSVQGTGIREAMVADANPDIDKDNKSLIWSAPWVIVFLIPFVAITTVPEIIYLVKPVWSEQTPPAQTQKHQPNRPAHRHK